MNFAYWEERLERAAETGIVISSGHFRNVAYTATRKERTKKGPVTDDEVREMIRLRAEGHKIPQIACIIDRGRATVWQHLTKAGKV